MEPEVIGEKYDKVASWWDMQHQNSLYGVQQVERAINYCKYVMNALDVGCGTGGRIIYKIKRAGFKITGIDVSAKMLDLARMHHPDINLAHADICTWNSDKKFNLIVAWDSIFHLPSDKQPFIVSKLCSMLDIEGILIYTFGDGYGDHEDMSFTNAHGKQYGNLENDLFGYGTIGIDENLKVLRENNCKCMHLELDQYPSNHVYVIAKKME